MASAYKTVSFTISDLMNAINPGEPAKLSVMEALDFYWDWAIQRGWSLIGFSFQLDPTKVYLAAGDEDDSQLAVRNEEIWRAVWWGEDVTGTCDLVADRAAIAEAVAEAGGDHAAV